LNKRLNRRFCKQVGGLLIRGSEVRILPGADVLGFHQPVVYDIGKGVEDVNAPVFDPITEEGLFIDDFDDDVYFGDLFVSQVTPPGTFTTPGST
jgi:hypothetical protein